jgi:hypothetical protein
MIIPKNQPSSRRAPEAQEGRFVPPIPAATSETTMAARPVLPG